MNSNGKDSVVLNRTSKLNDCSTDSVPIEIALCRECGQHYYVGRQCNEKLEEAVRDPSQTGFGVDYFLPVNPNSNKITHYLCRKCASLSRSGGACNCVAEIFLCASAKPVQTHADQLKECENCGYKTWQHR